jgi:hypothetical protein
VFKLLVPTYTGHTQKNGAVLILKTIKNAPLFCVLPVHGANGNIIGVWDYVG